MRSVVDFIICGRSRERGGSGQKDSSSHNPYLSCSAQGIEARSWEAKPSRGWNEGGQRRYCFPAYKSSALCVLIHPAALIRREILLLAVVSLEFPLPARTLRSSFPHHSSIIVVVVVVTTDVAVTLGF